jgi:hypothetical protein
VVLRRADITVRTLQWRCAPPCTQLARAQKNNYSGVMATPPAVLESYGRLFYAVPWGLSTRLQDLSKELRLQVVKLVQDTIMSPETAFEVHELLELFAYRLLRATIHHMGTLVWEVVVSRAARVYAARAEADVPRTAGTPPCGAPVANARANLQRVPPPALQAGRGHAGAHARLL